MYDCGTAGRGEQDVSDRRHQTTAGRTVRSASSVWMTEDHATAWDRSRAERAESRSVPRARFGVEGEAAELPVSGSGAGARATVVGESLAR